MNERSWLRVPNSISDNRKSKIQNLKLVGFATLVIAFVMCGAVAQAQQPTKVPRIGVLAGATRSSFAARVEAFQQGLKEHGYIESKTIAIEYRYAEGKLDRLPGLAGELVRLKVDLIVASGPGAEAAKNATKATPIVMMDVSDPVAMGLVVSLAHPGGNVTGLSTIARGLDGKRLELLKEAFPKISRVAVLWDPTSASNAVSLSETRDAAKVLRLTLQPLEVRGADDFAAAFMTIQRG